MTRDAGEGGGERKGPWRTGARQAPFPYTSLCTLPLVQGTRTWWNDIDTEGLFETNKNQHGDILRHNRMIGGQQPPLQGAWSEFNAVCPLFVK